MQQMVWNIVTMIAAFAVIAFVLVVLAEYLRAAAYQTPGGDGARAAAAN